MNFSSNKPKIILSSSLVTARRFVIQQSINGNVFTNFSLHTLSELSNEMLIRLKPDCRLISNDESAYILLTLIRAKDYGLGSFVKSFGAASSLLDVINDYRYSSNDGFANLVPAEYKELLTDYSNELDKRKLADSVTVLNLIRGHKQKEECYVLSDVCLRPLEKQVLESMFDHIEYITDKQSDYKVAEVFNCYGQYNEVMNVLDFVSEKELPIGDVEVLYSASIYENIVRGLCAARNIPYALKSAHAKSSNYVSFIYDILTYIKNDYRYELLENILANKGLDNKYLNQFYKTLNFPKYIVGFSRSRSLEFIKVYEADDKCEIKDFLQLFSDLLAISENGLDYKKLLDFAKKYVQAKQEINVIGNLAYGLTNLVELEHDDKKKIDLVTDLLDRLTYSDDDDSSKIIFSPISKSFTLRKYIFVLGVNQTALVGSDVENAFISDIDEYKKELGEDKSIHISSYQRMNKVENLKYYLSHSNGTIYLSFSSYDKINLKDMTEGVRLITDASYGGSISCYDQQHVREVFINPLTQADKVVEQRYDNMDLEDEKPTKKIAQEKDEDKPEAITEEKKKVFKLSPSTVSDLIKCPYIFYYSKILGIPTVEFPKLDEAEWLEPNKRGDLFHRTMELYFNNYINQHIVKFDNTLFEQSFGFALEEAEQASPISNQYIHDKEVEEMKKISYNYINSLLDADYFNKYYVIGNEFELKNLNYHYQDNENLILHGYVDRVDGYVDEDGVLHLRVVDYKSGKGHKKGDHNYYQHVLYSYVLKEGLKKLLDKGFSYFGLSYEDVKVDMFIYDFALAGDKLIYEPFEFDNTSDDYKKVFEVIDQVVVNYINDKPDLLEIIDDLFSSKYNSCKDRTRNSHGPCTYCKYEKECIKVLQWGLKEWAKSKAK